MSKIKIFNDPVYGFISFPKPSILLDVIDHPYFQRLRRISQTGMTNLVYPGANHTRFHHALGAYHLTTKAIEVLRQKGVDISHEEAEGVCLAVLMHDMGHGPFSHALENTIINFHHEKLSLAFMEALNVHFNGKLETAIQIFTDVHPKKFLYQLVSGQLDMDRLDYLIRDSYFTGVSEGVIGYDRIITMLDVAEGELVIEHKGIYSVEKFLIARRLMYWQVYLHKTVVSAEQMLIKVFSRAKELVSSGVAVATSGGIKFFLSVDMIANSETYTQTEIIKRFALIDDIDVMATLKIWSTSDDFVLSYLSKCILERKLFKLVLQNVPIDDDFLKEQQKRILKKLPDQKYIEYFCYGGMESSQTYNSKKDTIKILMKNGFVSTIDECMDYKLPTKNTHRYYLSFPKKF